jgi:uncharacterized membrane protein YhfC
MCRRVAFVRTDVSEEGIASIISERIGEVGTTLALSSNLSTLRRNRRTVFLRRVLRLLVTANVPSSPILVTPIMEAINTFETLVLTRATRCRISEDGILRNLITFVSPHVTEN